MNPSNGHLKLLARNSTLGKTLREFAIDPTGRWLIVGNPGQRQRLLFPAQSGHGRTRVRSEAPGDRFTGRFQVRFAILQIISATVQVVSSSRPAQFL
ncbi:MAG: hypothetical protein CBARDMAM_0579 [uncultured Caballeronia sp.]|nr:MAG: hypothetical protein CBARDMAM_0579 [uncultured Caballeronia sp.]